MKNAFLDPSSHVYLNNELFKKKSVYNRDNCLSGWRCLKERCSSNGINLNTIDFWDPKKSTDEDIYVSCDHKNIFRKRYWRVKNGNYPIVDIKKFRKKFLFQFEPPVVMPEIEFYLKTGIWLRYYDKIFLTFGGFGEGYEYFHFPQIYSGIRSRLWERKDRKFLTMINSNRKTLSRYKELLTERMRAITFFSRTDDIDLYGFEWDNLPIFPYWFHKALVKRAYRGSIEDKYEKLSEYNFSLVLENCAIKGYMTEKIFDCFLTGTVPVYLGPPDIKRYIPEKCFINMRNFKDYKELRLFLKSLKNSDIKSYKENARSFLESELYKPFTKENFAELFVNTIKNK